jgi:prepilin-type N-terminal cleavage/methylation domain-containing protein
MTVSYRRGFTLIELLVVIAIVSILSIVVLFILNPVEMLRQTRDSNRISDLSTVNSAFEIYSTQGGTGLGVANTIYISIPDPTTTSTAGDQCQGLGLPSLPPTYSYHCALSSSFKKIDGTGWIPVNLGSIAINPPLSALPVDPINTTSSNNYFTYITNGSRYELTAPMESQKYKFGGSNDVISKDGGQLTSVYERGSILGIEPMDYADTSLTGFWNFEEGGSSAKAYDFSGHNTTASATWNGLSSGDNSTHYTAASRVGSYAGFFDGATNWLTLPNILNTSAYTKAAWIFPTNLGNPNNIMSGDAGNVFWMPAPPYGKLSAGHNGAFTVAQDAVQVTTSTWYHVAVTYDGSNLKIYKNGIVVASATGIATPAGDTVLYIGAYQASNLFQGYMDNVRLYNRALNPTEVAGLYSGIK